MDRKRRLAAAASALALALAISGAARADDAAAPAGATGGGVVSQIVVTAQHLNAARQAIQPEIGASTYTITDVAIQALPGGVNQGLNQVVLQSPSVVQDSFGQVHVRGDHGDLQYRLNGVIIPEGLAQFGQILSPRLAHSVRMITGALPAQYGLRTAGIVDIATKTGFENEGQVGLYGGAHGTWNPSAEYGATHGGTNAFVSASYLRNQLGIESPDGSGTPSHDRSDQANAFAYLDHILGEHDRVSLVLGGADSLFQIPNAKGLQPDLGLSVNGVRSYPSERLNESQREITDFGIVSLQHTTDDYTAQLSVFTRYSSLTFHPDALGDLLYDGLAQGARKSDAAYGLQAEGVYFLTPAHTLRGGVITQFDFSRSKTRSQVLPVDAAGRQASDRPITIFDEGRKRSWTFSTYLQDEWKLSDAVTLNYGARFDQVNAYRHENQVSPRINAVWTPADGTTIHAGFSRFFSPPPFELVASQSVAKFAGTTGAAPGTQSTAPFSERDSYLDIGVQQKLTRELTLGVDTYYRWAKDLIDEGQFGAPIILTPFNFARGRIRGIEFSANYVKGPLTAYANLAISKAEGRQIVSSQFNFDPADLAYIAGHYIPLDHDQTYTGSAGVSYKLGRLTLSLDGLYGSGLRADGDTPNGRKLPAYAEANLGASWRFSLPHAGDLEARLDVINLTDATYLLRDGTGIGVGAPQYGARRGVFVGLTKFL